MKLKLKGTLVGVSFFPPNREQVELRLIIKRENNEDDVVHKLRVLIASLDPVEIIISNEE